jgi:hypothetical protein
MDHAYSTYNHGVIEDLMVTHNQQARAVEGMTRAGGTVNSKQIIEGFYLYGGTADLLNEVRKTLARSMTRVKFLVLDSAPHAELAIYREGDVFALAFIGRKVSTGQYYVSHPSITNDKYKNTRSEHYMILSSGLPHITKAVKKYAVPAQLGHVTQDICTGMNNTLSAAYKEARDELMNFKHEYMYSNKVLDEFANVVKGHPPSPEMVEAMHQYDTLKVEANAEKSAKINLCLFMFTQLPSGITLTQFRRHGVFSYSEAHDGFIRKMVPSVDDLRTYSTVDELPAKVLEKVSTLSMLENQQYLRGVGYKFRQNVFFVEIPEEEERALRIGSVL